MIRTALIARSLVSLLGLALIVLGVLFWVGDAPSLVSLHMLLGLLLVLCLWVLVALAFLARAGRGLAVVVFLWSLLLPAFGVAQLRLLPGPEHWVIQTIHLVIGLVAIGLGHAIAGPIRRKAAVNLAAP